MTAPFAAPAWLEPLTAAVSAALPPTFALQDQVAERHGSWQWTARGSTADGAARWLIAAVTPLSDLDTSAAGGAVSVAAWQLTSDASGIIESSVASSTVIPAAEVNPFAEDLIREQLSSAVGQAAEAEYSHPTTSAEIVDVAPSDLAMVTMDPESGEPVADVIVPSGSVLPTSVTKTFGTAFDDQTQVVVTLHERKVSGQEMMDDVAEFRELVSLVLDLVGGAPAGSPIRVTVSVAVDGVLVVEVQGPQQETVSFESEHHVNPGRPAARDEAERS